MIDALLGSARRSPCFALISIVLLARAQRARIQIAKARTESSA
jgi:hypothetical protein